MLRVNNWSHWEDELISECMLDYAKQRKSAKEAFSFLSEMMPTRSLKAIEGRWYSTVRKQIIRTTSYTSTEVTTYESSASVQLSLQEYVGLLSAPSLTQETIELINLRIRSMI